MSFPPYPLLLPSITLPHSSSKDCPKPLSFSSMMGFCMRLATLGTKSKLDIYRMIHVEHFGVGGAPGFAACIPVPCGTGAASATGWLLPGVYMRCGIKTPRVGMREWEFLPRAYFNAFTFRLHGFADGGFLQPPALACSGFGRERTVRLYLLVTGRTISREEEPVPQRRKSSVKLPL